MRLSSPRINPIQEKEWTKAQRDILKMQTMRGKVQNIFLTLAHHEKLAKRWLVFANHILNKSTLSTIDREILILRIGWLCQSGYEWGQHEIIAAKAGLSAKKIEAIKTGGNDPCWTERENLLLKATDELYSDAFITTATWSGLTVYYSTQQMMDLVFTVGQYNLVSMALNSFGVQLDEDLREWKGNSDDATKN